MSPYHSASGSSVEIYLSNCSAMHSVLKTLAISILSIFSQQICGLLSGKWREKDLVDASGASETR